MPRDREQPNLIMALDLGQASDYSALVIGEQEIGEDGTGRFAGLNVRYLERFPLGTSYVEQVERISNIRFGQGGSLASRLRRCPLVVDATGVGRAVIDLLRERGLNPVPVTITAGREASFDEQSSYHHVPKANLVAAIQVMLQQGRLRFADDLPLLSVLRAELEGFEVRYTPSANVVYSAREGQHDDIVLAVALAAYWTRRYGACDVRPGDIETFGRRRSGFRRRPVWRAGSTAARGSVWKGR